MMSRVGKGALLRAVPACEEINDLILRSRAQHGVLRLSKDEGWMHGEDSRPSFVPREPQDAVPRTTPQDEVVDFFTRSSRAMTCSGCNYFRRVLSLSFQLCRRQT